MTINQIDLNKSDLIITRRQWVFAYLSPLVFCKSGTSRCLDRPIIFAACCIPGTCKGGCRGQGPRCLGETSRWGIVFPFPPPWHLAFFSGAKLPVRLGSPALIFCFHRIGTHSRWPRKSKCCWWGGIPATTICCEATADPASFWLRAPHRQWLQSGYPFTARHWR